MLAYYFYFSFNVSSPNQKTIPHLSTGRSNDSWREGFVGLLMKKLTSVANWSTFYNQYTLQGGLLYHGSTQDPKTCYISNLDKECIWKELSDTLDILIILPAQCIISAHKQRLKNNVFLICLFGKNFSFIHTD